MCSGVLGNADFDLAYVVIISKTFHSATKQNLAVFAEDANLPECKTLFSKMVSDITCTDEINCWSDERYTEFTT